MLIVPSAWVDREGRYDILPNVCEIDGAIFEIAKSGLIPMGFHLGSCTTPAMAVCCCDSGTHDTGGRKDCGMIVGKMSCNGLRLPDLACLQPPNHRHLHQFRQVVVSQFEISGLRGLRAGWRT